MARPWRCTGWSSKPLNRSISRPISESDERNGAFNPVADFHIVTFHDRVSGFSIVETSLACDLQPRQERGETPSIPRGSPTLTILLHPVPHRLYVVLFRFFGCKALGLACSLFQAPVFFPFFLLERSPFLSCSEPGLSLA